ncbi:MAG: PEP-CTERM sorting domain-containing protein, partial [Rhodocyclaceae bacterium]|nr:PEP-CTERM sorting domain-containing protein [Rhodocyclaceae bacterium]
TLTAVDGGGKRQIGGSLVNNGSVLWNSSDAFQGGNSGSFTNKGLFEVASDADVTHNFGGLPSFANHGRFVKSAGGGETSVAGVAFSNNPGGVVDVQSGSIRLPNGFTNQGTLMGSGSFVTNTLTNAGHVAPGASPGTLSIAGNFVQTTAGIFDVEIGTLLASDRLNVSGAATIDGTLALSCFGACSLAQGDTLLILDAVGQLSGTFSNVTLTGFSPTSAFDVVYDYALDEVRLVALSGIAPVPEPQAWTLMLAGLGLSVYLARRRRS